MLIQDYLDICDPVLTFDRFMGEIELEKYLKNIPQHYTGRFRYDPVSMLKPGRSMKRYLFMAEDIVKLHSSVIMKNSGSMQPSWKNM